MVSTLSEAADKAARTLMLRRTWRKQGAVEPDSLVARPTDRPNTFSPPRPATASAAPNKPAPQPAATPKQPECTAPDSMPQPIATLMARIEAASARPTRPREPADAPRHMRWNAKATWPRVET